MVSGQLSMYVPVCTSRYVMAQSHTTALGHAMYGLFKCPYKTHFAKDATFVADTPITCTGSHQLMYLINGIIITVGGRAFQFNY